uniref:F-box domain-containing protein n=1 Tax=Globisporangium ultimum (strain ATCC 200006 / CBS 805.95 / DAOM BR144) TaxID=431595 RepID=K3WIF5_GLOUD
MAHDKAEGSGDDECGSLISLNSDERSMDVDTEHRYHHHTARRWIHAIQNASFQPKPTAYSPQGSLGEDPLWEKLRECQDKLAVLRQVRARVQFYPIAGMSNAIVAGSAAPPRKTIDIQTRMIFSQMEEDDDSRSDTSPHPTRDAHSVGIDTLSGLETLVFGYLAPNELIRASGVCRSWKDMARHDVIWEPRLFTPFERYPLREFLGLAADLPAMQVFMIFKRLRVSELPAEVGGGDNVTRAAGEMLLRHQVPAYRGRLLDERERFRTWMQTRVDQQQQQPQQPQLDLTVRLDDNISRSTAVAPRRNRNPVECVHLVCFHGQTPTSDAYEWPTAATTHHLQDQFPALFATIRGRGDRNDDEIHCVKDGYRRSTLKTWLQHQHMVSERVLRSFLRQMLVAVTALEQAGVIHSDISTMTILVLEPADALEEASEKGDGEKETTTGPIFQLLCSLNTWYCGRDLEVSHNSNARDQDGVQGEEQRVDDPMMHRRRQDDDVAVIDIGGEDENAHDRVFNAMHAAAFGQARQLRPPCMLTSVFRCAVSLYARGRFPDTTQSNSTTLLLLLSSQHMPLPSGFRACGEYAKFLLQTGSSSQSTSVAAQLLNHEYVATRANARNNVVVPIRPTNVQTRVLVDYQASILAWYGTLQAQVQAQPADDQSIALDHADFSLNSHLLDLMPRTRMGAAYLEHALEEDKLPSERFVSIVAPVVKESSWVRVLSRTQRHTLQRLDLSNADLPTSVLLDELMNLPRITHLRLPSKIERPDDIEHFLAALSCRELLPNLHAMDENVQAAMDRMEKTYVDQLGMLDFCLQSAK